MTKEARKKTVKAWAGIYEGKLDTGWREDKNFKDGIYGIIRTRKEAKQMYELVVPCTITYTLPISKTKK